MYPYSPGCLPLRPTKPALPAGSLPPFDNLSRVYDAPPPLKDELIAGCLRQGHKMLLSGPSKAGKSLALMALAVAIAEGLPWLGMPCRQGRVLYINLELDSASCWHRLREIHRALALRYGLEANSGIGRIDVWNLRGHAVPMDALTDELLLRAEKGQYAAVILDPIYKVITGDENSAEQMARFCNQFDRLCTALDAAVIYCHHHSKGAQGGKRAMDRASGSGVFARDPDAILDMIELDLAGAALPPDADADTCTAWRIESTLREFPKQPAFNVWLEYPLHRLDDTGLLDTLTAEDPQQPWERATQGRKMKAAARRDEGAGRFAEAMRQANHGEPPTVRELAEYLNVPDRTCRYQIKQYGYEIDPRTHVVIPKVGNDHEPYGRCEPWQQP